MSPLWFYSLFTNVAGPLVDGLLRRRLSQGKEDAARITERRGVANRPRPDGKLIWIHAASVGESQSSLALIAKLLEAEPGTHVLQTTGTLTSAHLMQERLPPRSFHQFVPADRLPWVRAFLDHWQPDIALWMESELWPNLMQETARRQIPSILVNARMSRRSFERWRWFSGTARKLLGTFSLCLAQTEEQADFLRRLGAEPVKYLGNLKFSAAALPVEISALDALKTELGGRPLWLAASTHPGEERMAADVHDRLLEEWPNILTVIVPRHPVRGDEIAKVLRARGFCVSLKSSDDGLAGDVYVADTLGELGLFYRLANVTFIGGSMASYGGHNPLEAAQLDCAVVLGPDMRNFATVARELLDAGGALQVSEGTAVAEAVARLLRDSATRERQVKTAARVAADKADAVVRIHEEIAGLMNGR
jgi:3-deoxy-D-manno-octulosonic-acid transferase